MTFQIYRRFRRRRSQKSSRSTWVCHIRSDMHTHKRPTHTGWHSWLLSPQDPRARCYRSVPTAGMWDESTHIILETKTVFVCNSTIEALMLLCIIRAKNGALCCHLRACVIFSSSSVSLSSPSGNLHSYARPPPSLPSRALSPPRGQCRERQRNRVGLMFTGCNKSVESSL